MEETVKVKHSCSRCATAGTLGGGLELSAAISLPSAPSKGTAAIPKASPDSFTFKK